MRLEKARVQYEPGGRSPWTGWTWISWPGSESRWSARAGRQAPPLPRCCSGSAIWPGGTATLGGYDLRAYRADDVRTVIGGCTQDPHIFNASIRENVRLARPAASDGELAEAARQARLLPWIESLPLGWDTPAGPRGGAVSGGERQRLALAGGLARGA